MPATVAPDTTLVGTLTPRDGEGRADADAVLEALAAARGQRYTLESGRRRVRSVTYLDTADWRLHRKGVVLAHERASGAGTLRAWRGERVAETGLAERPEWPALAGDLPEGDVRDLVAGPMSVRAVHPALRTRVVTREVVVRAARQDDGSQDDGSQGAGAVVAVVAWREVTGMEPVRTAPMVRVDVRGAPGREKDAKRIRKWLRASGSGPGFRKAGGDVYADALAAAGLPDRPDPPAITPDMPADAAVALALRAHVDAIAANVEGTLADTDTEYLHDLRVAVRRTRALVKQSTDVLPQRMSTRAREFRWLGEVTSRVRDLDVYLLGLENMAARLTAADTTDLDPFAEHLRRERDTARRALVRALRTKRFARLMDEWPAELAALSEPATGEAADTTDSAGTADTDSGADARVGTDGVPDAATFARQRLKRMAKKVARRAAAITPESPAEDVHDLRKRCKELRYLLEFARPLCRPDEHAAVLSRLKKLQDVLGAFQDGEVQSAELREMAGRMHGSGRAPAETLLAMGELAGAYAADQRRAREELTSALRRFLGADLRKRIAGLVR